ncbi:MAG: biotin/lipoyl-binding protein, partial [Muribaculaceae bacterium]|nr:biotin/lipoyl-binding protein [Muribaculaceae bacterium]
MKSSHILLFPAVALAFASCSGSDKKADEKTAEAVQTIDVAVPVVDTVTIHKSYPCFLSANMEVELVARVDGYLLSSPYNAGDFVKKGTVLFNIESTRYVDAVNQAVAAL